MLDIINMYIVCTVDWVIFVIKKISYSQLVSKFKHTNIIPLQNIFRTKFIGMHFFLVSIEWTRAEYLRVPFTTQVIVPLLAINKEQIRDNTLGRWPIMTPSFITATAYLSVGFSMFTNCGVLFIYVITTNAGFTFELVHRHFNSSKFSIQKYPC